MNTSTTIATLSTLMLAGCSLFGIRSGYEQPHYDVIGEAGGELEIRRYGPRLAIETTIDAADVESGQNEAFEILAAYIFGANRTRKQISMTAPVEVQGRAEKIAMTAPVETGLAEGRLTMRFFLPSHLDLESAPQPTDPRAHLVVIAAETVAVRRFSGRGGAAQVGEETEALLRALGASTWCPEGTPVTYFYDPPWTIPFLRRNEVAVVVKQS